jgi:hydroxyacylglutathione hydrolase
MLVRRFYDPQLAQASYLIACQQSDEAIVIDPARDIAPYLAAAAEERVTISRVAETHIHADFVSGARELAAATGAMLLLSGEGGPDWQYRYAATDGAALLRDGDVIRIGGVRLDVWHTPGHTPEHLAYLLTDAVRSDEPVALVSGDFVFVGDVGRPDLLERAAGISGTARAGARQLFGSLQRLAALPDYLQIWPGHGAGSACGKALGALPTSTLGYERRTNWAFGIADQEAFVQAVLEGQPAPPGYFGRMKRINRDGPPLLAAAGMPPRPGAGAWPALRRSGIVVDLRDASAYASRHLPDTINLPLNRSFATWAGWLLPADASLLLVTPDDATAADAVRSLRAIGLDEIAAVFDWHELEVAHAAQLTTLARGCMADAEALQDRGWHILDVRDDHEWAAGHLPGAEHIPLGGLAAAVADRDRTVPLAVHCESGSRSAIAVSLLERLGFRDLVDLNDGWSAWVNSGDAV